MERNYVKCAAEGKPGEIGRSSKTLRRMEVRIFFSKKRYFNSSYNYLICIDIRCFLLQAKNAFK